LTRYYCKFVKNCAQIASPLKKLLKKGVLYYTKEVVKDFEEIKEAMCTTPILATPNFTKYSLWSVIPQAMALVQF